MSAFAEEALNAHRRRVAGWATQAAHNIDCSTEELRAIERAALLHHDPCCTFRPAAVATLAGDLNIEISDTASPGPALAFEILQEFHLPRPATSRFSEFARILEWADRFDEQFELNALDPLPLDMQNELSDETHRLRVTDAATVLRVGQCLPVFPSVAQRAMRILSSEDLCLEQLEPVLRADPVLAAELLKVANSALFGKRQSIKSIGDAVQFLGLDATAHLVCATCLRPVFASRNLFDLWNHSIDAAETAERLALLSERVDPAEAFLAGLVHDIGRLAFSMLSCDFQVQTQRLLEYGIPALLVERALTGTDHAEIGSELLRSWCIPPPIPDAVGAHHELDESAVPLAAILYLAEFSTMADEDLPSFLRLDRALRILDLPKQLVMTPCPRNSPTLGCLKLSQAS